MISEEVDGSLVIHFGDRLLFYYHRFTDSQSFSIRTDCVVHGSASAQGNFLSIRSLVSVDHSRVFTCRSITNTLVRDRSPSHNSVEIFVEKITLKWKYFMNIENAYWLKNRPGIWNCDLLEWFVTFVRTWSRVSTGSPSTVNDGKYVYAYSAHLQCLPKWICLQQNSWVSLQNFQLL